jgi:hypothetical protein
LISKSTLDFTNHSGNEEEYGILWGYNEQCCNKWFNHQDLSLWILAMKNGGLTNRVVGG